jgi:hypothetical protein
MFQLSMVLVVSMALVVAHGANVAAPKDPCSGGAMSTGLSSMQVSKLAG